VQWTRCRQRWLSGGGTAAGKWSVLHTPGVAVDIAYGVGAVVGLHITDGRAGVGVRLGLVGSLAVGANCHCEFQSFESIVAAINTALSARLLDI
jgi:hypothetical protein